MYFGGWSPSSWVPCTPYYTAVGGTCTSVSISGVLGGQCRLNVCVVWLFQECLWNTSVGTSILQLLSVDKIVLKIPVRLIDHVLICLYVKRLKARQIRVYFHVFLFKNGVLACIIYWIYLLGIRNFLYCIFFNFAINQLPFLYGKNV